MIIIINIGVFSVNNNTKVLIKNYKEQIKIFVVSVRTCRKSSILQTHS